MRLFELIANEFTLLHTELRRYWFETLISYSFLILLFMGMFYGLEVLNREGDPTSKDALIFGFMSWFICWGAYNSAGNRVVESTNRGYLAQLFLSKNSFITISAARVIAEMSIHVISFFIILYLVMALTGHWIEIDFITFFGILFIGIPSIFGIGFVFAGLSLIFKKVESVTLLMMLSMVGLVSIDAQPTSVYGVIPLAPALTLTREISLHGYSLEVFDVVCVMLNSAFYFAAGAIFFRICVTAAKKRNLIGSY